MKALLCLTILLGWMLPAFAQTPPSAAVLDDFNRADEDPVNSNWSAPFDVGEAGFQVVTNEAAKASATPSQSYWSASTFGANQQAGGTVTTVGTSDADRSGPAVCIISPNTAGVDFYLVLARFNTATNDRLQIWTEDDGSLSQQTNDSIEPFNDDDKIAITFEDDVVYSWRDTGSGWSQVGSYDDSSTPLSCDGSYVGYDFRTGNPRMDNFFGGTLGIGGLSPGFFLLK